MNNEEKMVLSQLVIRVVIDHARKRGINKTGLARMMFPEESDPLRKLDRILKEGQQLSIVEAYDIAILIGEPLSHLILDVEGRMRQLREGS